MFLALTFCRAIPFAQKQEVGRGAANLAFLTPVRT
jgi:hypothetical protein